MHPQRRTTQPRTTLLRTVDDRLDAGLAELVAEVTAPASAVPSAEVVTVLARATAVLGGRELRAATRLAAERLERSLPAGDPPPAGLAGASRAGWALVQAAPVL